MYKTTPPVEAVTLFSREGLIRVFKSKESALAQLGARWIANNVGKDFFTYSYSRLGWAGGVVRVHSENLYILRNAWGEPLTFEDFAGLSAKAWRRRSRNSGWNGEGPVPGTGRYRSTHCYRRLATMAARRAAYFLEEEGEPAPRASRKANRLPNSWDDYPRSDWGLKSWKNYRKHQCKARG